MRLLPIVVVTGAINKGNKDSEKQILATHRRWVMSTELEELRSQAAEALNKVPCPDGRLGTELFNAVARVSHGNYMEGYAFRRQQDGKLKVFLRQRESDETYAGLYHAPGKVRMPGEKWANVQRRLAVEYGPNAFIRRRKRVGDVTLDDPKRGGGTSSVFLVEIEMEVEEGWCDVEKLPPMIDFHRDIFLPLALAAFKLQVAQEAVTELEMELEQLQDEYCDE